eukprot:239472_1
MEQEQVSAGGRCKSIAFAWQVGCNPITWSCIKVNSHSSYITCPCRDQSIMHNHAHPSCTSFMHGSPPSSHFQALFALYVYVYSLKLSKLFLSRNNNILRLGYHRNE